MRVSFCQELKIKKGLSCLCFLTIKTKLKTIGWFQNSDSTSAFLFPCFQKQTKEQQMGGRREKPNVMKVRRKSKRWERGLSVNCKRMWFNVKYWRKRMIKKRRTATWQNQGGASLYRCPPFVTFLSWWKWERQRERKWDK